MFQSKWMASDAGAGTALPAEEFFARARARLTLDVPAGITDPDIMPARGDHDADPVMAQDRRRCGRSARRRCWCRSSTIPSRPCC